MSKNNRYRAFSGSHKKGSYSHEVSPLHTSKTKKDPNNCFQPSELDTHLKLSFKNGFKPSELKQPIANNLYINNLSVQLGPSQPQQKKGPAPSTASITHRKNSKQYLGLGPKEELLLAEFRESQSKQKKKAPQTSFDETLQSSLHGGSYEIRKDPLAVTGELSRSNYIPKFKGSDPNNKFTLRSPPKVFSQPGDMANKFKKPNGRNQKSFDANAGSGAGPLVKYTPYLNSYLRPPSTANNSPRSREAEASVRLHQIEAAANGLPNNLGAKGVKAPLDKKLLVQKSSEKSPLIISKHRKTPSFDMTKRSENMAQKTMTPPILERMRKSADAGEQWQGNLESFNNKSQFQFAIRTRAGVAPNGTRKINQDSFIFHANYGRKVDRYLLGVCDGHGMNGHLASGFVKDTLPVFLLAEQSFESNLGLAFKGAFELCHQKLTVADFDCRFSGTTCVIVLLDGNKIITANAGDSRAVMGRYNNKGWSFTSLTEDHKPNNPGEAQRIFKSGGRIEPFRDFDGNFVGPSRVWLQNQDIPGLAMSRSIGDLVAASVGVSCTPEIKEFTIGQDDRFLIVASDGIWEFIENIDVVKIIAPFYEQNNIEGACDYLLGVALKSWQEEEEVVIDDITLILVFL